MNRVQTNQFSLQAIFGILTLSCLVLGYVRFAGWRSIVYALGPPILIAVLVKYMLVVNASVHEDSNTDPQSQNASEAEGVRLLISLNVGLAIWIPIMILLAVYEVL